MTQRMRPGLVQGGGAQRQTLPGCSGYGSGSSPMRVPHVFSPAVGAGRTAGRSVQQAEMGNRQSFRREHRESRRSRRGTEPHIPQITVIGASPLPAEGSMFSLPEPACTHTHTPAPEGSRDSEQVGVTGCEDDSGGQERLDAHSLSGSDGSSTPKGSRMHFIEVMMSSSPQVRRSMVLCSSPHLSSRSDSDSASLVSYSLDDERTSATLDPLEHEWMLCASDGEWDSLFPLLSAEPSLVLRKDFVTGFTCLHWAAKHGKPELIALIINFSKQHNVPISVDVRSNTGYTPLHVAAMHDHMEVVKLLVGAYSADVEVRDHSGRKACQYLTDSVSVDIQDIIGAYEGSDPQGADSRDGGRWRFSRVLQSSLRTRRLPNAGDCEDGVDGPREKPLRRKSSLSRLKPKLQRLRERTSQIVHSTSFRDPEDVEGSLKSRPKTHLFG